MTATVVVRVSHKLNLAAGALCVPWMKHNNNRAHIRNCMRSKEVHESHIAGALLSHQLEDNDRSLVINITGSAQLRPHRQLAPSLYLRAKNQTSTSYVESIFPMCCINVFWVASYI